MAPKRTLEEATIQAEEMIDAAQKLPILHADRLGGYIDDPWIVVCLLEAALPAEGGHSKRNASGHKELPFAVSEKELGMVRAAALEVVKTIRASSEEILHDIISEELDNDDDIILDHIFRGIFVEDPIRIQSTARMFVRKKLAGPEVYYRVRDLCLAELADPETKLGRQSRQLVHDLVDLIIDLQTKAIHMRKDVELVPIADLPEPAEPEDAPEARNKSAKTV